MRSGLGLGMIVLALAASACTAPGEPAADGGPSARDGGAPWSGTLGAELEPDGAIRFRVASTRATRIELWLYAAPLGAAERRRVVLAREGDGPVWQARISAADLAAAGLTTVYYGYRVWGPTWAYDPTWTPGSDLGFVAQVDADGDRMNPNKLLIDPYARELSHDPTTPGSLDGRAYRTDGDWRDVDSAPIAPKSLVVADPPAPTTPRPTRALGDDVIYEVHLRGLTAAAPGLPCAGTYAGALARADHLAALGVTAVELLPVAESWNDTNDVDPTSPDGDNYWGYSTLAFFAPDRRYACDRSPGGPTREFAAMVDGFHARGLKVFVDVVYNHTAEGGGSALSSLRGLDDAAYYELDDRGDGFVDNTGVGANTNVTSPLFRALVVDSLRYWSESLGVDGFRFDLAAVLGNACARGCFRFDGGEGSLLVELARALPARAPSGGAGVDLIAEPWGIGDGTYQLGHFPSGWAEWNDRFRDTIRRSQNQPGTAAVTPGWLADRIAGSPELFAPSGRPPAASIDALVSHDGFTLHDLYACAAKRNDQPWPWGPSSGGSDDNASSDQGGDPARQRRAARTGLALMALSAGVPMITGGDEMLRDLRCNNNSYNLDSVATWLDWRGLIDQAGFVTFTRRLFGFRAAHPALRPSSWLDEHAITWHAVDGGALTAAYLDDPAQGFLAWRLDGVAAGDPARAIYVAYDGGGAAVQLTLPPHATTTHWWRVADTGSWMEGASNVAAPGHETRLGGSLYDLEAGALVLFVER